jgi:hypothetical protein
MPPSRVDAVFATAVPASIRSSAADSHRHEGVVVIMLVTIIFVIRSPQPDGPSLLPERARFDFDSWWASFGGFLMDSCLGWFRFSLVRINRILVGNSGFVSGRVVGFLGLGLKSAYLHRGPRARCTFPALTCMHITQASSKHSRQTNGVANSTVLG